MAKFGILVNIEAKSGCEAEVEGLLRELLPLAGDEPGTQGWQAFKSGPSTFGVFAGFQDEAGRRAHLDGKVAGALLARTEALLARPPQIISVDILAAQ